MRRMSNSFSSLGSSQRGNTKQPDGQDVSSSNNLPKVPINPRREQHNNSHKDSRSVTTPLIDSAGPVATSPSAHLHSLPAVAELLSARKLYRSSYVWRLDHHPAAAIKTPGKHGAAGRAATTSQPPAFRRYYMRLEDCLLCFWPDDELKRAQAENGQVHPTSMNLTDAFVALTSTKPEWIKRCQDCNAPTPYSFSLNNAGANSVILCMDDETDQVRWMNAIRLAVWERQRLEVMYTAARLGIREEQQRRPVRSALSLTNSGAMQGRAEALLDVRLPGDTEWRQVYAVLTEPTVLSDYKAKYPSQAATSTSLPVNGSSASKKEKRRSFFGLISSSSKHDISGTSEFGATGASANSASSPVSQEHNRDLEDGRTGPTLALFGVLNSSRPAPNSPSLNRRQSIDVSERTSPTAGLRLTDKPIAVVTHIDCAHAVWPENEAFIESSKMFKLYGRFTWLDQVISHHAHSSSVFRGLEDVVRRDNRDAGRAGQEGQLLCNLAVDEGGTGPANAVRATYKTDSSGELLSWILGIYDAFRLYGRPERMIYDQRSPYSPYFAQPIGEARGLLYLAPELIEDMPNLRDNRPSQINRAFATVLYNRMVKMGAIPGQPQHNLNDQQAGPLQKPVSDAPPILPALVTSQSRPGTAGSRDESETGSKRSPFIKAGSFQQQPQQGRLGPPSAADTNDAHSVSDTRGFATPDPIPTSQLGPTGNVRDGDAEVIQEEPFAHAVERGLQSRNDSSNSLSLTPIDVTPLKFAKGGADHTRVPEQRSLNTASDTGMYLKEQPSLASVSNGHQTGSINSSQSNAADHYNEIPSRSTTPAISKSLGQPSPEPLHVSDPVTNLSGLPAQTGAQQWNTAPAVKDDEPVFTDEPDFMAVMSLADSLPETSSVPVKNMTIPQRSGASSAQSRTSTKQTSASNYSVRDADGYEHPYDGMDSNASPMTSPPMSASTVDGLPTPRPQREEPPPSKSSKASAGPSTEGHNDYIAGLDYLAMTAAEDRPQPSRQRPPREAAPNKPVMTVNTDKRKLSSSTATHNTYASSADDTASSAISPDGPLSPDPYDAPAEKQIPVVQSRSNQSQKRKTSVRLEEPVKTTPTANGSARRPGRGVPVARKTGRRLGTWSSDEESEKSDSDRSSNSGKGDVDENIVGPPATTSPQPYVTSQEAPPQSASSPGNGSFRRSLPLLPGPSTDPYINENVVSPGAGRMSNTYEAEYQQYAPNDQRASGYGWPQQTPMSGSPSWIQRQQMPLSPYGAGSGSGGVPSPYGSQHRLSPSFAGPGHETMLDSIEQNPETAGADGKAMRDAAVASYGLLHAGIQQQQARSAKEMEAQAKENGGPLLQLQHKTPVAQAGLVGAIATHERDRKREGGLGAALTERERERRIAEAKQREMDMLQARQASGFGNGQGMMPFGPMQGMAMPNMGFGNFNPMDPMQMQQQMAMLAAQNAYLQAMSNFSMPQMGGGSPYMSPPFSPHAGYGAPSQVPYAASYMGMPAFNQGMSPQSQGRPQQGHSPQPPYSHHNHKRDDSFSRQQ